MQVVQPAHFLLSYTIYPVEAGIGSEAAAGEAAGAAAASAVAVDTIASTATMAPPVARKVLLETLFLAASTTFSGFLLPGMGCSLLDFIKINFWV